MPEPVLIVSILLVVIFFSSRLRSFLLSPAHPLAPPLGVSETSCSVRRSAATGSSETFRCASGVFSDGAACCKATANSRNFLSLKSKMFNPR